MKTSICRNKNTLPAGALPAGPRPTSPLPAGLTPAGPMPAGSRHACSLAVVSAVFLFFLFSGFCFADAPAPASQKYQDLIHYQEQSAFITQQIQQIQDDLDWLTLKVRRMQDFDRVVPQRMHDSIAFKQSKIASLEKLKKRYQDLIAEFPPPEKISSAGLPENLVKENLDEIETRNTAGDSFTGKPVLHNTGFRQNLEGQMAASGLDSWLELVPHTSPVRLETRLPILFASASAQIPEGYAPFFENLANLIKGHDVRIVVDGYADTDPINTSRYPSNFELGAARAAAVVHALVSQGINPRVCKIGSTGRYRFDAVKTREWKTLQRHATIAVFFAG